MEDYAMATQNFVWMRSQHGGLYITLLTCELAVASGLRFVAALKPWLVASRFGTPHESPLLAEGVAGDSDVEVLHAHSLQQQDVVGGGIVAPFSRPHLVALAAGSLPQSTWCVLEAQGCA
jgi:hypothetical protein